MSQPLRSEGTQSIDAAVAGFYGERMASLETIERLTTLTVAASRQPNARPTARRALLAGGLAVAAALAMLAASAVTPRQRGGQTLRARSLAEQIALNHNKQLQVEFTTQSYSALPQLMAKLDFAPARPTASPCQGSTLVGGRYCSIGNAIAAQLKLRSPDGAIHTLYQTRWANAYAAVADRTVVVDGVQVRFWRQRDVLFGLASTMDTRPRHQ